MSKGVAIAEAINDATEITGAVTEIVDTVNAIQSEHIRGTEGSGSVEAQSGTDGSSTINVTELSEYIKPVSEPVRSQKDSYRPDTASCKNGDGLCVDGVQDENDRRRRVLLQQGPIGPEIIGGGGLLNVLGQFTPTGWESEALWCREWNVCRYRCPRVFGTSKYKWRIDYNHLMTRKEEITKTRSRKVPYRVPVRYQ